MATGHLLDTKTVNINEVLGNGKIYRVPQFQRDYSWDKDNWEDLWNDVCVAHETGNAHYMGSIVLQSTGGKEFSIIDGQQRFTTFSILILAVIEAIRQLSQTGAEPEANEERANLLMRQYIGQKDPSSLRYSSKLFLNENNDGFYQTRLLAFKEPVNARKLSDSESLMWEAYVYFRQKATERFKEADGSALATFLNNTVGELMMFIQITVEDELNAYTVFETLNSRGVELTSTDLLKNFLFSLVAKSYTDLRTVKTQWKTIIDVIGLKDFPAFLRYYLLATRRQITKEYLFKEIKTFVKNGEDVFELLDSLQYYAYNYVALGNPDDELWRDRGSRNAIAILRILRATQWKPLAMVAAQKLEGEDFKKLLQALIALTYRYTVIAKLQTNEMEKVYSQAAIKLFKGYAENIHAVLSDLKPLYVNDDEFKNYFAFKQFNTQNSTDKKLARYTLYNLEAQESDGNSYDFETDNGTIEHILPENLPEVWEAEFSEEEHQRYVYLLGNLTLLEPSKNNKGAANHSFDEKKKVYNTSKYALTNKIEYPAWTKKAIKHRQAHLAKIAASIWKIQFQQSQ